MNYILSTFALAMVLLSPSLTEAGPIVRSGDTISVDSAQMLNGDFYGFASKVTISGSAEEDVYVAGGTITLNAPVGQDLTVVGGVVQVHSDVGDDIRIIGGEVTIGNTVKGDVVVLGGSLTVLSTATVEGDILFWGGDLTVEGNVNGAIHGMSDTIRINAIVGGDVLYTAKRSFTLGDKAQMQGTITYESNSDIIRAQNAVTSEVHKKASVPNEVTNTFLRMYILQVCALLFVALSLYLLGRKQVQSVVEKTKDTPGLSGLIGLGVFLVVPFVSGILMVSVVGILAGVLLLLFYMCALIVAMIHAGITFGLLLQMALTKKTTITLSTLFLGIIAFCLLGFIPYIGGMLMFAGIIVALGGLSTSLYRLIRS